MARTTARVVGRAAVTAARSLHLANPLLTGRDVSALQKLLEPYHPGEVDGEYGPVTAAAVERAKWALGYPDARCDGSAGPSFVGYLQGAPPPADFVARQAARRHDMAKALTVREQIVAHARWGIENESQIHYEQLRPIDGIDTARRLPLHTDCSGFATLCYAWAGAPDPNGLDFGGQGYTGTMLGHMQRIHASAVQPGDLVVWGPAPGHHVALVLEPGSDPLLCSHGQEKGPLEIRFSVETQYQPQPAVWLSCLP
ncbi:MAG TPA: peptidoglycan-binding domain-containing protein [Gaiellaceae bacterium]|nr:peptidoglycan-binding domain-containing protein [Gaiellaceae bacterium]